MTQRFALACTVSALLFAPAAYAQDRATLATQRFVRGRDLFEAGRYDEALAELRQSLELFPSPNSRLYIARALRDSGRLTDAVTEFEQTLREAEDRVQIDPRYAVTRDAARDELAAVEPRVGRVTVRSPGAPPDARLRVGDRALPVAALDLPLAVMPGRTEVELSATGYRPSRRAVDVAAGASLVVALPPLERLRPPALAVRPIPREAPPGGVPSRGGRGPAPWIVLGVSAASFATAGVTFAFAQGQFDALAGQCGAGRCPGDLQPDVDRGQALDAVALGALSVGVVTAAVGLALVLLAPPAPRPAARAGGAR